MTRACVVFGAGEYYGEGSVRIDVPDDAFVVAADGGLDHTRRLGVTPDVVVGDFDSLRGALPADGTRTVTLPPLKDDPDLLSALKVGWAAGCRTFHIYGGLGGRIDHTLANINLLAAVSTHGGIAFLHGDGQIVTAITDGSLRFAAHETRPGDMVSVFAHGETARGVTETGLRYEIADAAMDHTEAVGVSNEFRNDVPTEISVRSGTLVVVVPEDAPLPAVSHWHALGGDLGPLDTDISRALVQ